jgi:nitroreductase
MQFSDLDLASIDYVLSTTRSVRKRLDLTRPVPDDVLLECLTLAQQAPTGSNLQTLRWVVVTDEAQRAAVAAVFAKAFTGGGGDSAGLYFSVNADAFAAADPDQTQKMMASVGHLIAVISQVPVLVIPCLASTLPEHLDQFVVSTAYGSAYPAIWSFQLALRSRGLASCLTTGHLMLADEVAAVLDLPEGTTQVGLLPVAWSIGTEYTPAKRLPTESVVHWNRW